MKFEDIQKEWAEDSKIDFKTADIASLNIPILHSKYITMLSNERLKFRVLQEKQKTLRASLDAYYQNLTDGKELGRPPFNANSGMTKSGIEKLIEHDKDYIQMNLNIISQEEKVLLLKEIIVSINQRGFAIKNYIDYQKFSQGQF